MRVQSFTHSIEPPIVNQQPLSIRNAQNRRGVSSSDKVCAIITRVPRDRVRQPTRRVHITKQHVRNRVPRLLARNPRPHDGRHVRMLNPRLDDRRAHRMRHDDRVPVHSGDSTHERVRVPPQRQVLPVALVPIDGDVALARVGVHEDDGDVLLRCGARGACQVPVAPPPRYDRAFGALLALACAGLDG